MTKRDFKLIMFGAFYKEAHCCVSVYDINGMISFDMLDN